MIELDCGAWLRVDEASGALEHRHRELTHHLYQNMSLCAYNVPLLVVIAGRFLLSFRKCKA